MLPCSKDEENSPARCEFKPFALQSEFITSHKPARGNHMHHARTQQKTTVCHSINSVVVAAPTFCPCGAT
jgi:hypothetical protein